MKDRTGLVLFLPLIALAIQWPLWSWISPFVWFFFYPAVFFCARFDGLRGGVLGALLSIGLVWYFFLPPQLSWKIASMQNLFSAGVFMVMGVLFGLVHGRIKREIAAADARFQAAFEQDGIGMSVLGLDGRWRKANRRFGQITGRLPEDIVGLGMEDLIHVSDRSTCEDLEHHLLGHEAPSLAREVRILRPAGPAVWGRLTMSVRWRSDGTPEEFLVSLEDLQDQKDAARILQEQGRIMKDVQHLASIGSWSLDQDMSWRGWSEESFQIFGLDPLLPPPSLPGMADVLGSDGGRQLADLLQAAMARSTSLAGQIQFETSGGARRILRIHAEPAKNEQGEPIGLYGLFQDVTEACWAENALRESEGRMRLLIDHAPASLAMFDRDMRYLAVSQRWKDDYHLDGEEILGRSHYEIFPEIPEAWREVHRRGLDGETIRAEADRFVRLDGSVQWLRWEVLPWRDGHGAIGGIVIFSEDITARTEALAALQESEERYRNLFVNSRSIMLMVDPATGRIIAANPAAVDYYGWPATELCRKDIRELNTLPPEAVAENLRRIRERETDHFVTRHRLADGSVRDLEVYSCPIRDHDRVMLFSILHDVTERRHAEEALQESRAKLAAAVESMQDAIFISDLDGRFLEFNEAFARFHRFGTKAECARTLAEYPAFLEVSFADGEPAPLSQWAVPRALRGEQVSAAEYRLRRKDTGEAWVGSYSFGPIRDEQGRIVGSVVIGRDITEFKRIEDEVRLLNSDLERRVRERTAELQAANENLERFAYAVSHDLRAPLRAMSGFSHILVEELGPRLQETERGHLEHIVHSCSRMSELISGILQLSRVARGDLAFAWVDLSSLAERLIEDLRRGEPGRAVEWHVQPGMRAWGAPQLIEALLGNLLGNAWKYTAGRTPGVIRFDGADGSFTVADNGAGFDMAHAGRLYQPFQRLHRQDEFPGLGIGLATVQRILQRHGGRIEARSSVGQGAAFTFTLPGPSEGT